MQDEETSGGERQSPWSASERVFRLYFSESGMFPCPDRSACCRKEREKKKRQGTLVKSVIGNEKIVHLIPVVKA